MQRRGTLQLRDTRNYGLLVELELPQDWWVTYFSWSPDGSRLYVLCLGHRVMYWDLKAIRRELAARRLDW